MYITSIPNTYRKIVIQFKCKKCNHNISETIEVKGSIDDVNFLQNDIECPNYCEEKYPYTVKFSFEAGNIDISIENLDENYSVEVRGE